MKDIMAIIRMNKVNQTKKALENIGISSFTATANVLGRGKGVVDTKILAGAKNLQEEAIAQLGDGPKLFSKRLITIVVEDEDVSDVVEEIIKVNQTGTAGDGKIFVLPVLDAIKVRTGEKGSSAL
jgi:nitrogen regulatory protein PII 2